MKKETVEEYFLENIKNVLLFKNDAQAIRFMEKYYQAKKEEEKNYSKDEVLHILDSLWDRLDVWYNEGVDENFSLREWFNECELKKK